MELILVILYCIAIYYFIKFIKKSYINYNIKLDKSDYSYKNNPMTETEKNL